eukprot:162115-Chlamydomonas_euryale.AAC.3
MYGTDGRVCMCRGRGGKDALSSHNIRIDKSLATAGWKMWRLESSEQRQQRRRGDGGGGGGGGEWVRR